MVKKACKSSIYKFSRDIDGQTIFRCPTIQIILQIFGDRQHVRPKEILCPSFGHGRRAVAVADVLGWSSLVRPKFDLSYKINQIQTMSSTVANLRGSMECLGMY